MSLNGGEKTAVKGEEKGAHLLSSDETNSADESGENEQKVCKDRRSSAVTTIENEAAKLKFSEANASIPVDDASKADNGARKRKRTLSVADTILSLVVIAPSVIGCWRGIWTLMDLHVNIFPTWPTFFCGVGIHFVFTLFREQFSTLYMKMHTSPVKRLGFQMVRILYVYLFGVACNAHWRCGWIILDEMLQNDTWLIVSLMVLSLIALAILRSLRNVLAPPFLIAIDKPGYIFEFPTRYKVVSVNVYEDSMFSSRTA